MIYGLGERLREKRRLSGLSQKQVANMIGVAPNAISNYEKGERNPSLEVLMKLAAVYNCTTDYLLMGKEKSTEVPVEDLLNEECS